MSIRKRKKLSFKSKVKRKKRRARLKAAGKDPDDYYYAGFYVGERQK